MKIDSHARPDAILEAAIKRFIHFGFSKTSFSEIARDLGLSQQSLYYYFPDKKALIREVISKINCEYLALLEDKFEQRRTITDKLMELVNVQEFFFKKYFMMTETPRDSFFHQEELADMMAATREKLLQMVTREIEAAIANKELGKVDAAETAQLLMETLSALQYAIKKENVFPDRNEIARVFKQQRELIRIYVAGLKPCVCGKQ
ncbi:MAG TPA: TetR/AcrR family transcriptional regulator [Flavitalea sp.]|nr:TetR/AcrR family transcriptional regulator [Flavitalea sp.]